MSNEEIKKIQDNVAASLAVEGAYVSLEAEEINKQFLKSIITSKEAINRIKNLYLDSESNV